MEPQEGADGQREDLLDRCLRETRVLSEMLQSAKDGLHVLDEETALAPTSEWSLGHAFRIGSRVQAIKDLHKRIEILGRRIGAGYGRIFTSLYNAYEAAPAKKADSLFRLLEWFFTPFLGRPFSSDHREAFWLVLSQPGWRRTKDVDRLWYLRTAVKNERARIQWGRVNLETSAGQFGGEDPWSPAELDSIETLPDPVDEIGRFEADEDLKRLLRSVLGDCSASELALVHLRDEGWTVAELERAYPRTRSMLKGIQRRAAAAVPRLRKKMA